MSVSLRLLLRIDLLLLTCGLIFASRAEAATRYGQESGLPSLLVQSIARDERGFLWIGTQDGVVRFDSHRFVPIQVDRGQAVPDPHVRRMLAVPGAVYLATRSRLHRFDLGHETLQRVDAADGEIIGINALKQDLDGQLYAGTEDGRLYRWRDRSDGARLIAKPVQLDVQDGPLGINEIAPGREHLWIATLRGVYRMQRDSGRVEPLPLQVPEELKGGRVHVSALHEDQRGSLWIGFWNDGLLRYDLASGQAEWLHPKLGNAGGLRSTSIYSFLGRDDRLYVGSNRGIAVHHYDCQCLRALNLPEWDSRNGSGVIVTGMVAEGDAVWAGVWGTGIARFSPFDEVIEHQVAIEGRSDSLNHPMIYSLYVDPSRRLWVGSYGGGVQWSEAEDRVAGRHWPLQLMPFGERRIESRFIWHLRQHRERLLVGSGFGLFEWDGEQLDELAPELQSVRSSLLTSAGELLIGTGFGLFRDAGAAASPRFQRVELRAGELPRVIWSMYERNGEIWLGTDRGIERLDSALRPQRSHGVGAGSDTLPGAVVWTQKAAADGSLWIGTSGGLVSLAAGGGEPAFVRHPLLAEAGVRSVSSIEFAADGTLWMGTPRGLLRYHPQRRELDLLDAQDGLVSTQINTNASASDGDRLYFGGIGGYVSLKPADVPPRRISMQPTLVGWRLGQGSWRPGVEHITLPHDHQPLQMEFSAFAYARPERVRYAYRWLPNESEFTELGDAHSAVFSRLPSGEHWLELRTHTLGPVQASAVQQLVRVEVAAVWYETWLGRSLILLLVVALWFAAHYLRLVQARNYARGLEREVSQRTRELSEAKEALEHANDRLRVQVALDPLTGLANRRSLFSLAEQLKAHAAAPGVLLIDLDHFKQVNDRFGHDAGDAVLVDFAELLRSQVRKDTLSARYGGEEFMVLAGDSDDEAALCALAERLVRACRERRIAADDGGTIRYSISVGVARGLPGEATADVIHRADQALYQAKHAGRDRWMLAPATAGAVAS